MTTPMPTSLDRALPAMLLVLTAVTGVVDAVSYLALGRVFTANMTGNVVFIGFAVGGAEGLSIPRSVVALLAFIVGAIIGGRMIARMSSHSRKRWTGTAFFAEAALLFAAAGSAWGFHAKISGDDARTQVVIYVVIVTTAVAMGLRNAMVRKLAIRDLTTTVLTLTITGLGADSASAPSGDTGWHRKVGSVLLMLVGAVTGAMLLRHSVTLALATAGAATAACAIAVAFVLDDSPDKPERI